MDDAIDQPPQPRRRDRYRIADLVGEALTGDVAILRRGEQRPQEQHEAVGIVMLAQRLSLQVFGIAADLAHRAAAIQRIAVGALDPQRDFGSADVVHRELVVEQAHERAERAGRVIVLRLAQQQRGSPFEIAQVDVVAQCRAHRLALSIDQQHDFGLWVVPRRIGPHADVRAPAHRRQHGRFGEDFRIRADRDLQILRPQALVDQRLLQRRGFG